MLKEAYIQSRFESVHCNVVLGNQGCFNATSVEYPTIVAAGYTRDEAIENLQIKLREKIRSDLFFM